MVLQKSTAKNIDPFQKERVRKVTYGWLVALNVSILIMLLVLIPGLAGTATTAPPSLDNPGGGIFGDPSQNVTFGQYVNNVYTFAIGAGALAAVLMIIVGGFMYTTSAGNSSRATIGKDMIVSALVGLLVALAAFLILSTVNQGLVNYPSSLGNNVNITPTNSP